MVRAWYHDGKNEDPTQPHMRDPDQFLTHQQIKEEIGLECLRFEAAGLDENPNYISLKKRKGFNYGDFIELDNSSSTANKRFVAFNCEHLHPDEEVRFVEAGSGYLDMRSRADLWIRLEISQGDFLIIPGGIYHRFSLTPEGYIKLRRLFSETPVIEAYSRPEGDSHPIRKQYLQDMGVVN